VRLDGIVIARAKQLGIVAFVLATTVAYRAPAMAQPPSDRFDFQYFESLNIDRGTLDKFAERLAPGHQAPEALGAAREAAAQDYLNEKFPSGTPASAAVEAITAAGAKCGFGRYDHNKDSGLSEYYYDCRYTYGLFVMTEWTVIIYTDRDGKSVKTIHVRHGFTGL
jgi:hypothetical protein